MQEAVQAAAHSGAPAGAVSSEMSYMSDLELDDISGRRLFLDNACKSAALWPAVVNVGSCILHTSDTSALGHPIQAAKRMALGTRCQKAPEEQGI